ncbi:hypothetical protein BDW62DRAFT_75620 [Aspergillus aurantiobrunneus]
MGGSRPGSSIPALKEQRGYLDTPVIPAQLSSPSVACSYRFVLPCCTSSHFFFLHAYPPLTCLPLLFRINLCFVIFLCPKLCMFLFLLFFLPLVPYLSSCFYNPDRL